MPARWRGTVERSFLMKKMIFAAALSACVLLAGVTPRALLRQFQSPQPTEASPAAGSQLHPSAPEPARFASVNSQYNVSADSLYLSFTNQSDFPVSLTGKGNLEIEKDWKTYYIMPRHDTSAAAASESGVAASVVGQPVAPGETLLFELYVGHYKPIHVSGSTLPFVEGSYRVSVQVRNENGSTYEWACLPFRMVAGQVQADQNNVTVSVGRSAYSPRTKLIRYTIENHSGGDLWYDSSARLQRLFGDSRWVDVDGSRQPGGEMRQLPSGASDTGSIAVSPDHSLGAGAYRVVKSVAGLDLASGQFTVPGSDALRFSLVPKQVSVDWYAKDEDEKVKKGWWTRTSAGRDLWLSEGDLYDGESAPAAILRELETFLPCQEPVGYSRDSLVELTLWDASDNNVTASLLHHSTGTYCLVGDKWYKSGDVRVMDRIKTALEAASQL